MSTEHDDASVSDEAEVTLTKDQNVPDQKEYIVISENGLFKNGEQYDEGSTIYLDDRTAANFIAIGDVEAAQ